jgi:hypothetical protein
MSQSPALQRLPHPWLDNSRPKPHNRPDVFFQLKSFYVKFLPLQYPYRPCPLSSTGQKIHYFLLSGSGPPPGDIGYPGDIYRDMTTQVYDLYACLRDGWVPWTGISASDSSSVEARRLLAHPNFPRHYLWCEGLNITWVAHKRLCQDANKRGVDLSVSFLRVGGLVPQTETFMWPGQKRKWEESENSTEGNELQKKIKIPDEKRVNREEDGESYSIDGWYSMVILRPSCCIRSSTT